MPLRKPSGLPLIVDWAVASRAIAGESTTGDMCLAEAFPGGVLLAVADGLGHGQHAAAAARRAIVVLRHSPSDQVVSLIQECHSRLLGTRGVVITVASISGDAMSWAGIGNVEGRLLHPDGQGGYSRESLMLRGGVVGYRMPGVKSAQLTIEPGDLIIFATDGISGGFDEAQDIDAAPQAIADHILESHGKLTDDALVFVARYHGNTAQAQDSDGRT